MEKADLVRVIIWPGILYLILRMGWRAYHNRDETMALMMARGALTVLFVSRSLIMAENWHQSLNWLSAPFTLVAMWLVWRSKEL